MNQKEKDILTLKEYFIIYAQATGKPYIDVNRSCYLFELKSEADIFCKEVKGTYITNAQQLNRDIYGTGFFSLGIERIRIKEKQSDSFTDVTVSREDVAKKQYFNQNAVRDIYRLKQCNQKKYLRNLSRYDYLTPVQIVPRAVGQYPEIHYSYATSNGEDRFYLLFTTIQEFENWKKQQEGVWKPLAVNFNTFGRIRKDSSVVINPMTDRLILSDKMIRMSLEKKEEE